MADENENNEEEGVDVAQVLNHLSISMGNMDSLYSPCPWPDDYDAAIQWIEEGKDPFQQNNVIEEKTAFHLASQRRDLKLLLHMAAKPGTTWTKRFMFCCGAETDVPVCGRDCISTARSSIGPFFHEGISMEGIEVMVMYGYKIKKRDIENICAEVSMDGPHSFRVLLFALAHAGRNELELEQCLGLAVGGENSSFFTNMHPSSLDLAKILLAAGANPNGYCFQGNTPYDFMPALYQAVKNRNKDMTKLLMKYGADSQKDAKVSTFDENGALDVETHSVSALAEENGMLHLLVPPEPETSAVVNVKEFIYKVHHDFSAPLRIIMAGPIAVAMMRATGEAPPLGVISSEILAFCNFFYN